MRLLRGRLWQLGLTVILVGWALATLLPLNDRPFAVYAQSQATAHPREFAALLREAAARKQSHLAPSEFVGLQQIARERRIDLSQFFPGIPLEASLRNIAKRNEILLKELLRRSKGRLQLGLDLKGGVAFTLEIDPKLAGKFGERDRSQKLAKAIDIIGARINAYGVAEPVIRPVGSNRIEVQIPGANTKDDPEIVGLVEKPAQLEFRLVEPGVRPGPGVETPPGCELMSLDYETRDGQAGSEDLFVRRIPAMTGGDIANAFARTDLAGAPEVVMQFTAEGKRRFAAVTRQIAEAGRRAGQLGRLGIVLDGKLYSAPTVREEIDSDSAQISGGAMTEREALDTANVLNNPLDLPLIVKEQYEVGPSLAEDAIRSGARAAIIGTALVAAFMITFYTTGGVISVLCLAANILIILGTMASFGATMTLPGLAGIVLTIGMAVDANILIFERMREELAAGKSLATANRAGFAKALPTILDAHAVQLIICAIMIWLGRGPIKGFGVTLCIGVLSTLFSVLVSGHLLMEILCDAGWLKRIKMRRMLGDLRVDFIRYGKPAAVGSVLLVLVGFGCVLHRGSHIFGIDFTGGDLVSLRFNQRLDAAKVRDVAQAAGVSDISATYVSPVGGGAETLNLELPEGGAAKIVPQLQKAFPEAGLAVIGESRIGASIGHEILWNALKAVGFSMIVILLYIAFRFEFGFGVGAMASTLHDVLMNIGVFVLFGHRFSAPMVAAILCVIGYSINETVVVFDRIREELALDPNGRLADIINSAIRKVFARTIMTASTTFLAALALFVFGRGVLRDISFTFLVGIATSTFSAIFIAAQVFYWWHKGDRRHVEAHADMAPKYAWAGSSKASR